MFERSSVFYLQLLVIKVKLHRSRKPSHRSAGKALHPGEPRAKSRIEVFEYIYMYIYVYIYMWTLFKFRPNLPACPMYPICCAFWHVSQDLLPQEFLTLYSYFEIFWKVRSQVALQAIVRISISISFGPLWGWADLLPPQQQHKQTSRMTWLDRAYF